jgi:hypothetical protein
LLPSWGENVLAFSLFVLKRANKFYFLPTF